MPQRCWVYLLPLLFPGLLAGQDLPKQLQDIQTVADQGRGSAAGRAAWERVSTAGPELLPALLKAMDRPEVVTGNWLRTAFDRIVERDLQAGGKKIDVDALLAFVQDAKRQGRARRLALETAEKLRPGTSNKLYAGWREDPEFRYEGVALLLEEAQRLLKAGDKDKAQTTFRAALASSRDQQQGRAAAAGLLGLGVTVSVAEHLGFLTDWYIIGPFDSKGKKGYHLTYPPEQKVDLAAELDGQSQKVRWKRFRVKEPPPTSGARHQALVNIPEALGNGDDAVAFAYTEFSVPAAQEVEFRGAADDNFTVWVNGLRAFGYEEWRNGVRFDRHRFKVRLHAGKNTVLVKVCQTPPPNPEPNWEFFLRVVDPTGKGIPMKNALQ